MNDDIEYLNVAPHERIGYSIILIGLVVTLYAWFPFRPEFEIAGLLRARLYYAAASKWATPSNNDLTGVIASTSNGKVIGHGPGSSLSYRIAIPDGAFIGEQPISSVDAVGLEDNANIEVYFDANSPMISRIRNVDLVQQRAENIALDLILAITFSFLLLGLLWLNQLLDYDHLNRFGVVAKGLTVAHGVGKSSEGSTVYYAAYCFVVEGAQVPQVQKIFVVSSSVYEELYQAQGKETLFEYLTSCPKLWRLKKQDKYMAVLEEIISVAYIFWMIFPAALLLECMIMTKLYGFLFAACLLIFGMVMCVSGSRLMRYWGERRLKQRSVQS